MESEPNITSPVNYCFSCNFTPQYLDSIKQYIAENLRHVAHAPSVQMHDVPPDLISIDGLDEPDPDMHTSQEEEDRRLGISAFINMV